MGLYEVTAPCVYVVDGRAVRHRRAGALVELGDEVTVDPADAVRRLGVDAPEPVDPPSEQEPTGQPATFVTDPPAAPGCSTKDLDAVAADERTFEDKTDIEQIEPKPKRGRGKAGPDGQD